MNLPILDLYILKSIISDYNIGADFARRFGAELFSPDLQKFAKYILSYIKTYKAQPTRRVIIERNANDNINDYVNFIWNEIDSIEYNTAEYPFDVEKLIERYQQEQILNIKNIIAYNEINGKLSDVASVLKNIDLSCNKIKSLNSKQTYTQQTLKESISSYRDEYKSKELDPELAQGVMTGYSALDYATGGLKPAEMVIIGGETGAGKSTLLNNIAIQMWMQKNDVTTSTSDFTKGYNVMYFSLEMPFDRCRNRTLARMADVSMSKLWHARLDHEEKRRLNEVLDFIERYPYEFEIIDIPRGATIEQLELRFLEAKTKFNPDIVVVDYLGLMSNDKHKNEQDWLKLGHIAADLHEFSRVYNVIMLTAVQLTDIKRNAVRKEDKEDIGVHRIGRSSQIMHHANIGIQIVKRKDESDYPDLEYQLIKNRDGPMIRGSMWKNFANARLIDIPFDEEISSSKKALSSDDISRFVESNLTSKSSNSNIIDNHNSNNILFSSAVELEMDELEEEFNNDDEYDN